MVKEILSGGHTFREYALLPNLTKPESHISKVSLETKLTGNIVLRNPFLSAAMQSVTNYEMALELGKQGGMGVLPVGLKVEEQSEIVRKIKEYEMSFVEDPVTAKENETIEGVLRKIEIYGHSRIPIVDEYKTLLGMFTLKHYVEMESKPNIQNPVTTAMILFSNDIPPLDLNADIPYCKDCDISVKDVEKLFRPNDKSNGKKDNVQRYLVVIDKQNRIRKLAFKRDTETIPIASAISTYRGWRKRVEKNIKAGVDLIVIDTSDAHNVYTRNLIKEYKSMNVRTPICAGNVVTYVGAMYLMKAGADIIKVGMSSGSMCTTKPQKGVGRAPMTALIEVDKARQEYFKKEGRYIPLIMDGGVSTAADVIIALSIADVVMMGYYFNRFFEAAGEKFDEDGNITRDETKMKFVEIYGEGSKKGLNLLRYDHSPLTFYEQGVVGKVPYEGRLKPFLKSDLEKIKDALSNTGCRNLEEFRKKAVIELNSPEAYRDLDTTFKIITN